MEVDEGSVLADSVGLPFLANNIMLLSFDFNVEPSPTLLVVRLSVAFNLDLDVGEFTAGDMGEIMGTSSLVSVPL